MAALNNPFAKYATTAEPPAADAGNPFAKYAQRPAGLAQPKDNLAVDDEKVQLAQAQMRADKSGAPVGEPGFVGGVKELGKGLARGAAVRLPEMAGETLKWFDPEGESAAVSDYGQEMVEGAEARLADNAWLQESELSKVKKEDDAFSLRGGVGEGGEMLVPSMGLPLAGAAAGSVIPGVGTAAGAAAGFIASLPLYFGAQAQDTYERVRPEKLKEATARGLQGEQAEEYAHDQAWQAGMLTGGIEAGGEAIADRVSWGLFRYMPRPVRDNMIRSATKAIRNPIDLVKDFAKVMATEVGTELGQGAAQQEVEEAYGVGEGASWNSIKGVIVPTMVMSALTFGGAETVGSMSRRSLNKTLSDAEADPEQRAQAVLAVDNVVRAQDTELADIWMDYAGKQVAAGQPVTVDQDQFYRDLGLDPDTASEEEVAQRIKAQYAPDAGLGGTEATGQFAGPLTRAVQGSVPQPATPPMAITPEVEREDQAERDQELADTNEQTRQQVEAVAQGKPLPEINQEDPEREAQFKARSDRRKEIMARKRELLDSEGAAEGKFDNELDDLEIEYAQSELDDVVQTMEGREATEQSEAKVKQLTDRLEKLKRARATTAKSEKQGTQTETSVPTEREKKIEARKQRPKREEKQKDEQGPAAPAQAPGAAKAPAVEAQEQETPPAPVADDARMKRTEYRNALKNMAEELVEGGGITMVPKPGAKATSDTGNVIYDYGSENVERQPSQNPAWFKNWDDSESPKPTVAQIKKAVDKALAGEKLGKAQERIVRNMLDTHRGSREERPTVEGAIAERDERRETRKEGFGGVRAPAPELPAAELTEPADFEQAAATATEQLGEDAVADIIERGSIAGKDDKEIANDLFVATVEGVSARNNKTRNQVRPEIEGGQPVMLKQGDTAILITPSAKNPGEYQVTRYGESGVFGDSQYTDLEQLLQMEVHNGMTQVPAEQIDQELGPYLEAEAVYQGNQAPPALELEQQTPEDIAAQNAAEQAAKEAERKEQEKQQADEELPGFTLTGSERPVDQAEAQGQTNLLDLPAVDQETKPLPQGRLAEVQEKDGFAVGDRVEFRSKRKVEGEIREIFQTDEKAPRWRARLGFEEDGQKFETFRDLKDLTPIPDEPATTTFQAEMGMPDEGEYRTTPEGQPTVPELVQVGDVVTTNYGTGPYRVINVEREDVYDDTIEEDDWDAGPAPDLPDYPPHWVIEAVDLGAKQKKDGTWPEKSKVWLGELVAVDGEILHLFKNNDDQVTVIAKAGEEVPPSATGPQPYDLAVEAQSPFRPGELDGVSLMVEYNDASGALKTETLKGEVLYDTSVRRLDMLNKLKECLTK